MHFNFKALDQDGRLVSGNLQALSHSAALSELSRMHLLPVAVDPSRGSSLAFLRMQFGLRRRLGAGEIVAFTLSLAALLKAGLVLHRALGILGATSDRTAVRRLCAGLQRRVREGSTFADALETDNAQFPRYYITMTRSGELGGSLAEGLAQLGSFVERAAAVRERIIASLIYPAILLGMIFFTLLLVLTVVLPRFQSLFAESQVQLPVPTRIALALGDFVRNDGWECAVVTVFTLGVLAAALRDAHWRARIDGYLLRARWTLGLIGKIQSSRFIRTIGTLARNGVPLPAATGVALGMLDNRALQSAAVAVHERLKQGQDLSSLLDGAQVFPKAVVQLVRVGEETGRLHEMLVEAADTLDREAQATIDRLLGILVPSITIFMGAVVAALIGSVLVGILSLNDLAF